MKFIGFNVLYARLCAFSTQMNKKHFHIVWFSRRFDNVDAIHSCYQIFVRNFAKDAFEDRCTVCHGGMMISCLLV